MAGKHASSPPGPTPPSRLLGFAVVACLAAAAVPASAAVVTYATYLGGSGDEAALPFDGDVRLARDGAGNVYVTGTTASTDFPTTAGAYRTLGGGADLFVTKFSPGGAVLYSTYLGGPCEDSAGDIAVDGAGNAYVTGQVNGGGTCVDLPGVLVAKLDASGNLVYATRLGGRLLDASYGTAVAVDGDGHAYVAGAALTRDFPTTAGAYRREACPNVYPFAGDAFVAKLSADGGTLVYSTLLCGQGDDVAAAIAIDAAGNAYVAGITASSDFPTVDPIEQARGGGPVGVSGFVSKLSPDGSHLVYSTYLGGSGSAVITGIALDGAGHAYVTGETDAVDFPTTPGVVQEHPGKRHCIEGCTDAFVSKIAPSGSALVYSTYLYGELDDAGSAIAVDAAGDAWVVGTTNSGLFPVVRAFQHVDRGLTDAFVVALSPDATRFVLSSYLGGSRSGDSPTTGSDSGTDIVLDEAGNAYVAGYTTSLDLPATADPFQRSLGGGVCDYFGGPCGDAFLARIDAGGPGVAPAVRLDVSPADAAPGGTIVAAWAGNPTPSESDYLRLFTLGSAGDEFDDALIYWPTPNAAAGELPLPLPVDLPVGWYELRLLSPAPGSGLAVPIARSEPIRVDGSIVPAPPPPLPPPPPSAPGTACEDGTAGACDDGDPCTIDECAQGRGCVSTPASGFESVTCTCRRTGPAACDARRLPASIARACSFFDLAAGAADDTRAVKHLRRGMRALKASIAVAAKSRRKGVSRDCAGALQASLRDAKDRAERLSRTLGQPRR